MNPEFRTRYAANTLGVASGCSVLSPGSLASEPDPVNLAAQLQFPLLEKKKKKSVCLLLQ